MDLEDNESNKDSFIESSSISEESAMMEDDELENLMQIAKK